MNIVQICACMINLFRNLHPFNLLWLIVVLVLLRTGVLLHLPGRLNYHLVEPFLTLQLPVNIQYVFEPVENFLCATLLVFIQALWLNKMVSNYNLMGKPNFLPALMFVVCSGLFLPFTIMSRPLICNFFILWICKKAFELYKSEEAKSIGFDMGFIAALATLVYFPMIFLVLATWIGLVIFRAFNWREWVAVIVGYLTVFFFLAVLYYWNDSIDDFYQIWLPLGSKLTANFKLSTYTYIALLPVAVIVAVAFINLREFFFKTSVHIRKIYQWLFVLFVIATGCYYVQGQYKVSHFLLCAVPVSVTMAYFFSSSTKRWLYESLFILLVGVILFFQYSNFLP